MRRTRRKLALGGEQTVGEHLAPIPLQCSLVLLVLGWGCHLGTPCQHPLFLKCTKFLISAILFHVDKTCVLCLTSSGARSLLGEGLIDLRGCSNCANIMHLGSYAKDMF